MLTVERLTKTFTDKADKVPVLTNVNFSINKGEMVALVGPSGAGKTTLLQIVGGLDRPSSGTVSVNNTLLSSMNPAQLAAFRGKFIGFVFQFHHLLPDFTALENVSIPGLIAGKSKTACLERAKELLDAVGLSHRLSHFPSELSGGERQRVALTRALFNEPALILADEPTGNLDKENGKRLMELFHTANERFNQTFIVATHNSALTRSMHRTLHLEDGVITEIAHSDHAGVED
jgi:lipoprotein-releasing system ATP-binding protein